ncbi:MAG TPA: DNRLRE domain-containing protein [Candidatus Eisenbacteria bacterium]|nr:DNRLRE domain-containing protein [Candidatus Eisenbacteria bacterium]
MYRRALGSLLLALTLSTPVWAETVTLTPSKDNTIFSENGGLSSGVGTGLYSGEILTGPVRRALLAFDVSSIPASAVIDSVQLVLTVTQTPESTPRLFRVFRVLADWGEGASNSLQGRGAPAQTNDATWTNTFFPSSLWSTQGGDFAAAASDSADVAGFGTYTWRSAGLAGDVHGWTSQTSPNYGWILIGDEVTIRSVREFSSREGGAPPQLTIHYSVATPVNQTTWGKIKILYR